MGRFLPSFGVWGLAIAALLALRCGDALGQDKGDASSGEIKPLALKEEMIRDRYERFRDRVYRLRGQLAEVEPDNAARLGRVLERSGELALADQLEEIIRLLRDSASLTEVVDAQDGWIEDAGHLLRILRERDSDNEERRRELDRLDAYRQDVKWILERERGLRAASAQAILAQRLAEERIARARDRLEQARHELEANLGTTAQAQEQREVAEDTRALGERLGDEALPWGQRGRGGQPRRSPPGARSLDRARQDMDHAAESLDRHEPGQAVEAQDEATEELEQALRELEDVLTQLRQEDREETLRDLESRFREMLSLQRDINASTTALAKRGREAFGRAEQLELAELSAAEHRLSSQAAACGHILDEEGTTVVFPRIVGQVAEDMEAVAERLAALHVGPLTQGLEQEIVDTLEQLLEALRRMQQENEQQQSGGMSGDSENTPLLPPSAELKLLRSSQIRVNSRTTAIEQARFDRAESEELLARALAGAATRQAECAEMARDMRDRQGHR